jgi:hypothetical protein
MDYGDLVPDDVDAYQNSVKQLGVSPTPDKQPGAFGGFWRAIGGGVMQGATYAARGAMMAGSIIPRAADLLTAGDNYSGKSLTDQYFGMVDDLTKDAPDYWKPDPIGIGKASQVAGGFAKIALPLMAAGGNPALVVAGQQMETYDDLTKQGVDGNTANMAALARGVSTAAGFLIPGALVSNRIGAAAIGATVNPSIGIGDRAAIQHILERADYNKIAEQYKPFDGTQIALDALVGAAGGFIGARGKRDSSQEPTPTSDEHAAALSLNEARVAQEGTLAKQNNPVELSRGIDEQSRAVESIERGEPVTAGERVTPDAGLLQKAAEDTRARIVDNIPDSISESDASALRSAGIEIPGRVKIEPEQDGIPELEVPVIETTTSMAEKIKQGVNNLVEKVTGKPQEVEATDPLKMLVDQNPDRILMNDDGTQVKASDLYESVRKEAIQAEKESGGYLAAVQCFLQHGGQ